MLAGGRAKVQPFLIPCPPAHHFVIPDEAALSHGPGLIHLDLGMELVSWWDPLANFSRLEPACRGARLALSAPVVQARGCLKIFDRLIAPLGRVVP